MLLPQTRSLTPPPLFQSSSSCSELSRELNQLREQYGLEERTDISDFSQAFMEETDMEDDDGAAEYNEEQASLVQILNELKAEVDLK
jgi:hypothetical protein